MRYLSPRLQLSDFANAPFACSLSCSGFASFPGRTIQGSDVLSAGSFIHYPVCSQSGDTSSGKGMFTLKELASFQVCYPAVSVFVLQDT